MHKSLHKAPLMLWQPASGILVHTLTSLFLSTWFSSSNSLLLWSFNWKVLFKNSLISFCCRRWGSSLQGLRTLDPLLSPPLTPVEMFWHDDIMTYCIRSCFIRESIFCVVLYRCNLYVITVFTTMCLVYYGWVVDSVLIVILVQRISNRVSLGLSSLFPMTYFFHGSLFVFVYRSGQRASYVIFNAISVSTMHH